MSLLRLNRQPSRRQLRVFAAAWLAVFGVAAARLWLAGRHPLAAEVVAAAAAAAPLLGLASTTALRWLYVALSYAVYPVGFVVSHVILAIVYYLVLTPIGLAARLAGHDPLARRPDGRATTFWRARTEPKPPESYLRQA